MQCALPAPLSAPQAKPEQLQSKLVGWPSMQRVTWLPWHWPIPSENGVHGSFVPTQSGVPFVESHLFPMAAQFVRERMPMNVHVAMAEESLSHWSRNVVVSHGR